MDEFLARVQAFVQVMMKRRITKDQVSVDEIVRAAGLDVPDELLPALDYPFRRLVAWRQNSRLADWEGGFNNVDDEDSLQVSLGLQRAYGQFYRDNSSYVSNVLVPACLILLIRERRMCTVREAEELFHEIPPRDPEAELRVREEARAEFRARRELAKAAIETELKYLRDVMYGDSGSLTMTLDASADHSLFRSRGDGDDSLEDGRGDRAQEVPHRDSRFDFLTRDDVREYADTVAKFSDSQTVDNFLTRIFSGVRSQDLVGLHYAANGNSFSVR